MGVTVEITLENLKKLQRPEWQALLDSLKAQRIDHVIEATGAEYRLARRGHEWRGVEHDSLVVDPEKGLYQWHSRHEAGDVFTWVRNRYGVDMFGAVLLLAATGPLPTAPASAPAVPPPTAPPLPLPQDLHLRYHRALDPAARQWWYDQGLTDQGIARFFLGVCDGHGDYGRAYTIPVIENGVLVNLRPRLAHPSSKGDKYRPWDRGRGTHLFNADILTPELGGVVITAGEKKAMVLWEHGIPAVSPTGGCNNWRPAWTTRLRFCRKVYIAYDPTPAEQDAARKLGEDIGERAWLVTLPAKPDDFILAEGREAFRACLRNAEPVADRQWWLKQLGGRNLWGKLLP